MTTKVGWLFCILRAIGFQRLATSETAREATGHLGMPLAEDHRRDRWGLWLAATHWLSICRDDRSHALECPQQHSPYSHERVGRALSYRELGDILEQ